MPLPNESGQTTSEYGVVFALIIVTAVGALLALGTPFIENLWSIIIDAWPAGP
jgi:Flp pilus assembly pilin Flp